MQITTKQKPKNKFGQYFTPAIVADFMIDLANIQPDAAILEPSCGEGVFLEMLKNRGFHQVIAYEIDSELATDYENVRYESFISANIQEKFDVIIGNPPYIRWANLDDILKEELIQNALWNKYFNSLCDYLYIFILKSIELLKEGGQLVFICPEYWLSTTHSLGLRNYMVKNGYFEEIYHFNETPIFEHVSISTIIFKYIKSKKSQKNPISIAKYHAKSKLTASILKKIQQKTLAENIDLFEISPFQLNERWILAPIHLKIAMADFEKKCQKQAVSSILSLFESEKTIAYHTIGDFCTIGNGLVSGLDKAFQIETEPLNDAEKKAVLQVIKAKDWFLENYYGSVIEIFEFTKN
jgi:adenine-specific DNA-methyltransferase